MHARYRRQTDRRNCDGKKTKKTMRHIAEARKQLSSTVWAFSVYVCYANVLVTSFSNSSFTRLSSGDWITVTLFRPMHRPAWSPRYKDVKSRATIRTYSTSTECSALTLESSPGYVCWYSQGWQTNVLAISKSVRSPSCRSFVHYADLNWKYIRCALKLASHTSYTRLKATNITRKI